MGSKKLSILIIEDNESDIYLAESALEELEGFNIDLIVAVDGSSGLKALKEDDFDVAFVDFNLPKYDGPTILKRVSAEIRSKCYILTTSDAETHINETESLDVAGYITKPLNQAHFRAALNSVVHVTVSQDVKFLHKKRKK